MTVASLGIVGSVTSTFAWYSYNTKDSLAYHGIASGNSQNLQIRMSGVDESGDPFKWKTSISSDELIAPSVKAGKAGNNLVPMSFKETQAYNKVLKDFYGRPQNGTNIIRNFDIYGKNPDTTTYLGYMQSVFQIRSIDPVQSTADSTALLQQYVYISDIRCIANTPEGKDMSDAVRVHIKCGESSFLIAPGVVNAEKVTDSINLYGSWDSDGDGNNDQGVANGDGTYYEPIGATQAASAETIVYGTKDATESFYTANGATAVFENDKYKTGGFTIGRTGTSDVEALTVEMTVYLQGWAASCIDANAGAEFDLGITFQVDSMH